GEHERQRIAIRKVAHEKADQDGDDEAHDHAENAAQQVGQQSARQPEIECPPATQHVRRAQVREYQSFQRGQPDDDVARPVVPRSVDQEITEHKSTDHSEPRTAPAGETPGTLHELPPQETDTPASLMNVPDLIGVENAAEAASARVLTSTTSRPDGRP